MLCARIPPSCGSPCLGLWLVNPTLQVDAAYRLLRRSAELDVPAGERGGEGVTATLTSAAEQLQQSPC